MTRPWPPGQRFYAPFLIERAETESIFASFIGLHPLPVDPGVRSPGRRADAKDYSRFSQFRERLVFRECLLLRVYHAALYAPRALSSQGEASNKEEVGVVKEEVAEKPKGIEKAVQYSVGHKTRVDIMILLNEGIYTAAEISEEIGVPLNTLHNHLRRLLDDGSIEIAGEEKKGNMNQYKYRAVEIESYTVEEFEQLPFAFQQNIVGAIFQSGTAEGMAGLYAGKLADPRATVFWDWFNLDAETREKADALTERYIENLRELECEATNRIIETKEETTSMLASVLFFERARKADRRRHRESRKRK